MLPWFGAKELVKNSVWKCNYSCGPCTCIPSPTHKGHHSVPLFEPRLLSCKLWQFLHSSCNWRPCNTCSQLVSWHVACVYSSRWSRAQPTCTSRWKTSWWTKSNFLGLVPKCGKDQWDCEINVTLSLQFSFLLGYHELFEWFCCKMLHCRKGMH